MPQPKPMRKLPVRRCVGCGENRLKKDLVRVVRTAEGEVLLDATGRKAGRGAYLCHKSSCFETARKKRSLQRALAADIPPDVLDKLLAEIAENEEPQGDGSDENG